MILNWFDAFRTWRTYNFRPHFCHCSQNKQQLLCTNWHSRVTDSHSDITKSLAIRVAASFFYQAAVCTMPLMAMPHLLFCFDTTFTSCCYIKMHNPEPVAYAENLLGGFIQWHMVAISISCALFVTSQFDIILRFQTNVLAKFVDTLCMFFYTHSPYFMCHCTKYELSALQARISEENKLNAITQ